MTATPGRQEPDFSEDGIADRMAAELPDSVLGLFDDQEDGDAPAAPARSAKRGKGKGKGKDDDPDTARAAEQPEGDEDEGQGPDAEEPEEGDDEDEEGADGEGDPDGDAGDDPLYEVTLPGGDKAEIPVSELVRGYSRNEDYKRKTAELADRRRALERAEAEVPQKVAQATEQQEVRLSEAIGLWVEQNPLGEPPAAAMLESDPERYHVEKARYEERLRQYQAAERQMENVARAKQARTIQQYQSTAERVRLDWPEFATDVSVREDVLSKAQELYGITAQEVAQTADPRMFKLLRDAMELHRLKAAAPAARKKARAAPPPRPAARGGAGDTRTAKRRKARDRFAKTGDVEDAVSAFEDIL